MRILDLALKDLLQIIRDRKSLLFLLLMPVVFTFFFGFAFGATSEEADLRPVVGVVNNDPGGLLSQGVMDMLNASATVRLEAVDAQDAAGMDARIVKGELAAGLTIPADFSAQTLAGGKPEMELVINEESDGGQTARRALQTVLTRVLGTVQTAQSSLAAYEQQAGALDGTARQAYLADAVTRGLEAWKSAPLSIQTTSSGRKAESAFGENPYDHFSPGMIIMFVMFGLQSSALVLVIERKTGAMARLLTTPMRKSELIAGHLLAMFLLIFLQQLILVAFGQLILKVNYLAAPLAVLLVMAALALWVASFGLLIATLAKKEDQVVLGAMIGMFVFSALGGAWFSLEMVGKVFATIGHLTPTAWAIDGYQNIVTRGLGFGSVLLPAGVIIAYAAAFFAIAVWKFRYE